MQVDLINSISDFERVRTAWEAIFAQDAHASVFMTWAWLRGWFEASPYPWAVLGVRADAHAPWLGFLPISIRGSQRAYRLDHLREIHMGGSPGADYTGLLCAPGHEQPVTEAMAEFLKREVSWDRVRLMDTNDPRLDLLLSHFSSRSLSILDHQGVCCPFVDLPATWEEYVQNSLSYETRKSLRKKLRQVETECRITHLDRSNRDEQINALIDLATMRRPETAKDLNGCRGIFQRCADADLMSILIIWHDQTPIAGMGSFIDRKANSLGTYTTGFNDEFAHYSPGRVVNALTIQYAIEQKFRRLDFLRGDEPYKMQFGAQCRYNRNITIVRHGWNAKTRMAMERLRARLNL